MKKYTFTIALIGFILLALTGSELWLGVAIGSLLLTPILQGVADGWEGKPKEDTSDEPIYSLFDEEDEKPVFDPFCIDRGGIASDYDEDGWRRW